METKVLIFALFSLGCLLHSVIGVGQCGAVDPASKEYQFLKNCDNTIPRNPKTPVLASTSTSFALLVEVKGGTLTNYTNIIPGVSYSFTTCEPTNTKCPAGFDPVIVIRDPKGNVLASNDDCATCLNCPSTGQNLNSYVTYDHPSAATFSWITVSVFAYNSATTNQNCYYTMGGKRYLNLYHKASSTSTPCVFSLTCNSPSYSLGPTGTTSVPTTAMVKNTNTCGQPITANQTTFTCDDIGTNYVKVSLYDKTCTTTVKISDMSPPNFDDVNDCGSSSVYYNFTSVRDDSNYKVTCPPGVPCYVNVYNILPPQIAGNVDENCIFYDFFPYSRDFDTVQPIGATFDYDFILKDDSGNSAHYTCTEYTVQAIHILDVEEDGVFEEEYYFSDTSYTLSIEYSSDFADSTFSIALLPSGIEYAYAGALKYATYDSFENGIFTDVQFPSSTIDAGAYTLLVLTDGEGPVVSIGNPLVYISGSRK